jgi:hypothetical protein
MQSKLAIVTGSIAMLALACGGGADDPTVSTQSSALGAPTGLAVVPNLTPAPTFSDSTVPVSGPVTGDVNPYGVAFVPRGFPAGGLLHPGDVIVSNFNNSNNAQGTGATIVRVNNALNADPSVFFTSNLIGLSTGLGVLQRGYVLVGNVPSTGMGDQVGMCTQNGDEMQGVGQGALQVIDRNGQLVETVRNKRFLDGPWDLTVKDEGSRALVFVSNALTGTVTRLDLLVSGDGDGDRDDRVTVTSATQIASGYVHRCDSAAFVVAPTGVALDEKRDILYVASAGDNEIFAISDASDTLRDVGRGRLVVHDPTHLHGPLGLALAPNGDLVSAQGDAVNPNPDPNGQSEIAEFTPAGTFVALITVEPMNAGAAFGLAVEPVGRGFRFAAVDDFTNTLDLWVVH